MIIKVLPQNSVEAALLAKAVKFLFDEQFKYFCARSGKGIPKGEAENDWDNVKADPLSP